jgi:hypothetical protein
VVPVEPRRHRRWGGRRMRAATAPEAPGSSDAEEGRHERAAMWRRLDQLQTAMGETADWDLPMISFSRQVSRRHNGSGIGPVPRNRSAAAGSKPPARRRHGGSARPPISSEIVRCRGRTDRAGAGRHAVSVGTSSWQRTPQGHQQRTAVGPSPAGPTDLHRQRRGRLHGCISGDPTADGASTARPLARLF